MSPPRPCEMTNRNKNNKTGFDNLGCSNIINTIRTTFQTRYFSVPKSVWICQLEDFGICQFPNPFYTKFSSHCDCTSFQINAWNVLRLFFIQVRFFCWWSPLKKSVGFLLQRPLDDAWIFSIFLLHLGKIFGSQDTQQYNHFNQTLVFRYFVYKGLMMLHS